MNAKANRIERFEAFQESSMSESGQSGQAFEGHVLVGGNNGQVRRGHVLEFGARITVGHEHIDEHLQRALPVDRLAEEHDRFDRTKLGLLLFLLLGEWCALENEIHQFSFAFILEAR